MAGDLGALVLSLSADTAMFRQDMQKATGIAQQHADGMKSMFNQVKAVVTGAVVGGLAIYIKGLVDMAEATNKLATRTGHTVEFLSELRIAAAQNNTSFEDLGTAMAKFNLSMVEARDTGSKTGQVMKLLGVDITKGPTEAFKQFAERASLITDAAVKTSVFRDVLGKTGDTLIPMMANLDAATASARKMGGTMATETAVNAEKLNDSLNILSETGKNLTLNALAPMIAAFATMADNIAKAAERGDKWTQFMRETIKLGGAFVGGAGEFLQKFPGAPRIIGSGLQSAGEGAFNAMTPMARGMPGWDSKPVLPGLPAPNSNALTGALTGTSKAGADKAASEAKARAEWILKMQMAAVNRRNEEEEEGYKIRAGLQDEAAKKESELFKQMEKENFDAWAQNLLDQEEALNSWALAQADASRRANEAIAKDADEQRSRQLKAIEKDTQRLDDLARDLGMTFSSAFEDAIVKGKSFRDVLNGIAQDILRIGTREMVTKPAAGFLTDFVKGIFGGGSGGGLTDIQAADMSIAGAFAGGGSFMVGGGGGADSQSVNIRATPGERVDVLTPSQQRMSGGVTVTNVFHISGATDRRSQAQIATAAGEGVNRALARNT